MIALFVTAWAATFVLWFTRPEAPGAGFALLVGVAIAATAFVVRAGAPAFGTPRRDTVLMCALATALRVPALAWPLGFVGADGSLQAFLTLRLLDGTRPAPIFLDGSSYEGSLKAHVAAALGFATGHDEAPRLLVASSLLLWWICVGATMALARRLGGARAAILAGLFVALSPRFATIFSVSNAGPYPDALGLGTLALAWAARIVASGHAPAVAAESALFGTVLGVAFWQQPIVASFGAVAAGALVVDAFVQRRLAARILPLAAGALLGRLPATLHDLRLDGAASEVVSSFARGAGGGLPLADQLVGTLTWAFPVVFFGVLGETTISEGGRAAMGMIAVLIVAAFAAPRVATLVAAAKERRVAPEAIVLAQFALALALVWLVAGEGQYSRPRYFLTLFPAFAVAFGCVFDALARRARAGALAVAAIILLWNVASNVPRIREGVASDRELRAFASWIGSHGLRAGYSDFSISGPVTMAARERVIVAGLLGPMSGEHVTRHVDFVAARGADFLIARPSEVDSLSRRLGRLGVTFEVARLNLPILYKLSRPLTLQDLSGFRENP